MSKLLAIFLVLFSSTFAYAGSSDLVTLICNKPSDLVQLKQVVSDPSFDINKKVFQNDLTATMLAASEICENFEALEILISKNPNLEIRNSDGETALNLAVSRKKSNEETLKIVKSLLRARADINTQDKYGLTPLHKVIGGHKDGDKNIEILDQILALGPNVNIKDISGQSPLFCFENWSSTSETKSVLDKLIAHGALLNLQDLKGFTPINYYTGPITAGLIPVFLEVGADPNIPDENGGTPLMYCAYAHYDWCVRPLLAARADPNILDNGGKNSLMYALDRATYGGVVETVQLLISSNVNTNVISNSGDTPLLQAIGSGDVSAILTLLFSKNPTVDVLNSKQKDCNQICSPFIVLATIFAESDRSSQYEKEQYKNFVLKAIELGANKSLTDEHGKTAYDYATRATWGTKRKLLKP